MPLAHKWCILWLWVVQNTDKKTCCKLNSEVTETTRSNFHISSELLSKWLRNRHVPPTKLPPAGSIPFRLMTRFVTSLLKYYYCTATQRREWNPILYSLYQRSTEFYFRFCLNSVHRSVMNRLSLSSVHILGTFREIFISHFPPWALLFTCVKRHLWCKWHRL